VSYVTTIQATSGLTGYWQLTETTGTNAADSSGNLRTATYTSPSLANTPDPVAGSAARVVTLNGTSSRVQINYSALNVGAAWSVEAWFNPTVVNVSQTVFGNASTAWALSLGSTGLPSFHVDTVTSGAVQAASVTALTAGQWYHMVGTWDGSTALVYINGVQVGTIAATGSAALGNVLYDIGCSGSSLNHFLNGSVAHVATYNVAVPAATVAAHYSVGTSFTVAEADSTQSSEFVSAPFPGPVSRTESTATSESVGARLNVLNLPISDHVGTSESIGGLTEFVATLDGTLAVDGFISRGNTDEPDGALGVSGALLNIGVHLTSAPTGTGTLSGHLAEIKWAPSLRWGTFLWGESRDVQTQTSAQTGGLTVSGVLALESYRPPTNYVDRPSGRLFFNGSSTNVSTVTYHNALAGVAAIAGTSGDALSRRDAGTGAASFSGFLVSEVHTNPIVYVDAPSSTLTVSGSPGELYSAEFIDFVDGPITDDGSLNEAQSERYSLAGIETLDGFFVSEAHIVSPPIIIIISPFGTLTLTGTINVASTKVVDLDQLIETGIGSTDWTGGYAPVGGTHTGLALIIMVDNVRYLVAHDRAEVLRKADIHAIAPTTPEWVAFDVPDSATPIILDVRRIQSVA
jgi:hypothetical protein